VLYLAHQYRISGRLGVCGIICSIEFYGSLFGVENSLVKLNSGDKRLDPRAILCCCCLDIFWVLLLSLVSPGGASTDLPRLSAWTFAVLGADVQSCYLMPAREIAFGDEFIARAWHDPPVGSFGVGAAGKFACITAGTFSATLIRRVVNSVLPTRRKVSARLILQLHNYYSYWLLYICVHYYPFMLVKIFFCGSVG
jgi:hypothetical protein